MEYLCMAGCGRSYERKDMYTVQSGRAQSCKSCHEIHRVTGIINRNQHKSETYAEHLRNEEQSAEREAKKIMQVIEANARPTRKEKVMPSRMLDVDSIIFDKNLAEELKGYEL